MHNSLFYDKIIATHFFNKRLKGTIMNPTRILLIHTEETRTHFNALGIVENEPLETEILYTVLKQAGHPVRIYDPDREPACFEELLSSFAPTWSMLTA